MIRCEALIPWSSDLVTLGRRYADRIAVQDGANDLTYSGLCAKAHALAAVLCTPEHRPGRRIGVLLGNGIPAVVADYALSIIGGCIVHLNPAYSESDLQWCLQIAPFDLLITEFALLERVADLGIETLVFDDASLQSAPMPDLPLPAVRGGTEARIIFTSGSTGKPKAVVYTQQKRWMAATVLRSVLSYRPDASGGIALMTPYVHGASSLARAYLDCGGCVILMAGVDSARLRSGLQVREIDALFAPPSVLAKVAEALDGDTFLHVRCVYSGTQPLPVSTYQKAVAIFGKSVRITYGKSENLNPISVLDPQEADEVYAANDPSAGTCTGYLGPGVEVKLSDSGEILLRSQHGYDGYLTESGFIPQTANDWHETGDRGYFDEAGRLWLTGRTSDVINTGGYMVSPDEIEAALSIEDAAREICVLGLPSSYWTQIIVCAYVPRDKTSNSATGLMNALTHLTKYKRPRLYVAMNSMIRTPAGKVDRRATRDWIMANYTLIDGPYPVLEFRGTETR